MKTTAKEKHGIKFHHESLSSGDLSSFVIEIKDLASEIQNFYIANAKQDKPFRAYGSQ
jgi:hypothetical protein